MSKTLRLTVTSDVHLSDWTSFSEMGPDGRPSRLLQYLTLAEDICRHAEANGSDAIAIAGDLVETSVLRPMVLDVLNDFIDILSDFPIYLIHGNHDLDTRKAEISPFHSVLNHLKKHSDVYYADSPTVYKINGFSLAACPWGYDIDDLPSADVFLGHGVVSGSSNSEGYIFRGGFQKEELFEKFRVSVVGDIHKGQTFEQDGKLVLIPGPPLQNSYKDPDVTGIWNVALDKEAVSYQFTAIHDIRPNFYHKFIFTPDRTASSSPLVHYRYKPNKTKESVEDKSKPIKESSKGANLFSITSQIIDQAKIENKDKIKDMLSSVLSNVKSSDRTIPNSKIHSVSIHNFLSIGDFKLDMNEFSDSVVIVGSNGAGKSSLFESLYWCLTGSNTRGVPVTKVVNDYCTDKTASVEIVIEIEKTLYTIARKRGPDGPSLTIQIWDDGIGQFSEIDRSTSPKTQDTIYKMLGLSASEIRLLSYFSSKEPVLFGNLGATDKNNLIATISGTSEVESLRMHFGGKLSDTEKSIIRSKSAIETLHKANDHLKGEIKKLMEAGFSDSSTEINNLLQAKSDTEKKLAEFGQTEDDTSESLLVVSSKFNSLKKTESDLESEKSLMIEQRNRIASSIAGLKEQIRKAMLGKCPTCGQPLHDEDVLSRLNSEVADLTSRMASEESIIKRSERLVDMQARITKIGEARNELESNLRFIRELNRKLAYIKDGIADLQKDRPNYEALINVHQISIHRNLAEISATESALAGHQLDYDCAKWIQGTLLKRNGLLVQSLNRRTKDLLQEEIDELIKDQEFSIRVEDDLSISASFLGRDFNNYKELSVGLERVVDIVMLISLNNLFTKLYALDEGVLGLVIFDEVMSFLDPYYIDFCYECLQRLRVGKRSIITHDDRLAGRFDNRINVSLSGRENSVYTKSW
jgi:hypothetical protein